MDLQGYYNQENIRRSLDNFFAGCTWFLTSGSHYSNNESWGTDPYVRVFGINEFYTKLGQGPDIFRPLICNSGVLGVFDIEYHNWDKKILFMPLNEHTFTKHNDIFKNYLEPVYRLLSKELGNEVIADKTWSGYHLLMMIERWGPVYNELLRLGWSLRNDRTPKCLEHQLIEAYNLIDPNDIKREKKTEISDGVVYHMFGRVLEYLCHKVIKEIKISIPIHICDPAEECISLDISQYADPVYMRIIRSIFSSWDKHNMIKSLSGLVNHPAFVDVIRKYNTY